MSAHTVTRAEQPTEILAPRERIAPARPPRALSAGWRSAGSPTGQYAIAAATVAVAGLLCLATFLAGGGLNLATMTTLELILTLLSGVLVAAVALLRDAGARSYGAWSVGLLLALTALTAVSVAWSVAPDASWQDANRMFSYVAVYAAAVALAWIAPAGWRALLGGVVLGAATVCAYALLTKVLPNHLDANDVYARLQEPYGYWNAVGLTAAMGAVACLWLGARRSGHALLSALAYPGLGLMLVTLMLTYSRGALVALAVGVAAWMALVPLRLRGVRVLAVAVLGAGPVVAWDFSRPALKDEAVAVAARATAGHQFGVLLAGMLLLLLLAGVAIGFLGDRRAPRASVRRAAGYAIAALSVLALAGAVGALAASKRGLTGTISHDLSSLADPNAKLPANTAGRLTAVGSVRARYWKEAIEIFEAHPALGAGAAGYETARLRYRTAPIDVRQAHGYAVQTLADLGLAGGALTLALLLAWMAAAGRSTHPFNRRWQVRLRPPVLAWRAQALAYTPERVGLLTMLCVVIAFGVHSFVDWTWYVPGNALVALLCAGWLAGRGPLPAGSLLAPAGSPRSAGSNPQANGAAPPERPADVAAAPHSAAATGASRSLPWPKRGFAPQGRVSRLGSKRGFAPQPLRLGVAAVVLAFALLAAWTEWQPQRSVDASEQALALLRRNPAAALAAAQAGVQRDPLSASALFRLAAVQHATGRGTLARSTLQSAVKMQPSNPETWITLGEYDLHSRPAAAVQELRAAVYLDPRSVATQNVFVEALRAEQAATAAARVARHTNGGARSAARTNRAARSALRNANGGR